MEEEGQPGGGDAIGSSPTEHAPASQLHTATTTALKTMAAIPRMVLHSRTTFAGLLAQSFHIQCSGSTPASVVFPLPLADFGLFASSGPKLSFRRWRTLVRKRMRHIIILALNFIHGGLDFQQLHLLGRRPNVAQKRAHDRLWALMTTCDSPEGGGLVPLSPGRSGVEFIARLQELEHFAHSTPLFEVGGYGGAAEDQEPQKVGSAPLNEENLPHRPYTSLNTQRLKLVGKG